MLRSVLYGYGKGYQADSRRNGYRPNLKPHGVTSLGPITRRFGIGSLVAGSSHL